MISRLVKTAMLTAAAVVALVALGGAAGAATAPVRDPHIVAHFDLAATGAAAVPAAAAITYQVTATIGVGSNPAEVGVDPATNTIYVANKDGDSVSVIDGTTNTVTATISVGSAPYGVAVDPATNTIYATSCGMLCCGFR